MVISHWCKLVEGLQVSPADFYKSLEAAIDRRQIPGLERDHLILPEGGLLSAKRDYSQLRREKLLFAVCAAPFGTGFFVSCRLIQKEQSSLALILVIGAALLSLVGAVMYAHQDLRRDDDAAHIAMYFVVCFISVCIVGYGIGFVGRRIFRAVDESLINIPEFGEWWERVTRRNTFYRIDLVLMFQSAVHAAILETVDKYMGEQHLQPLSELERKPVLNELAMR